MVLFEWVLKKMQYQKTLRLPNIFWEEIREEHGLSEEDISLHSMRVRFTQMKSREPFQAKWTTFSEKFWKNKVWGQPVKKKLVNKKLAEKSAEEILDDSSDNLEQPSENSDANETGPETDREESD